MGKRTSDFLAIAAIVSGAGVGLGLTSLRAENGPVMVHDRDESTVRVQGRRGMRVEPGHISLRTSPGNANVYMWRRQREDLDRSQQRLESMRVVVEQLRRGQLDELRSQVNVLGDSEELAELLEGLEGLESLELDLRDLRMDVQREGENEGRKRRRRRRPPRRMTDRPNGPSN